MTGADKVAMVIGGVLLAALIVYQTYSLVSTNSAIKKELDSVKELVEKASTTELPPLERDPSQHYKRVIDAWEKLPITTPLDPWDFYPDLPLPSR